MARFEVFRNSGPHALDVPYLLDVQSDREPIALTWIAPAEGAALHASDFPVTLALTGVGTAGATRLEVHIMDASGDRLLTSVVPPESGDIRIFWPTPPTSGAMTLRAKLFVADQLAAESAPRAITVGK